MGGHIFKLDRLFIPVNLGRQHWTLIEINMQAKSILYFDSMGDPGTSWTRYTSDYQQADHRNTYKRDFDPGWSHCPWVSPKQQNDHDCGVFV